MMSVEDHHVSEPTDEFGFEIERDDIQITDDECLLSDHERDWVAKQFNDELPVTDENEKVGEKIVSMANLRDCALVLAGLTLGFVAGRRVFSGVNDVET